MKDSKKEDFLDDDFNEIDARLSAGWYVHSGQRKRYLKSLKYKERSRDLKIRDSKLLNYRIIFRKLFPKVNN